ncbi:uncharacterized protein SOCG_05320 [Schizosaccharomyces octosporus yFS286]|uniref:Uncharacterized protein n=1 Tax=Schizosaccharomyces octosporus (strain yFS286) TaxID=483514 RepID=S9Q612_SCHOY|nr:uncharacterized protein SOCG_05320 [Schizosaccharomyces octosporus yFS286]EPX75068.1 hypothetical protein SOCG_05320 [Schizosaccharomyces octosporus yFS286]
MFWTPPYGYKVRELGQRMWGGESRSVTHHQGTKEEEGTLELKQRRAGGVKTTKTMERRGGGTTEKRHNVDVGEESKLRKLKKTRLKLFIKVERCRSSKAAEANQQGKNDKDIRRVGGEKRGEKRGRSSLHLRGCLVVKERRRQGSCLVFEKLRFVYIWVAAEKRREEEEEEEEKVFFVAFKIS